MVVFKNVGNDLYLADTPHTFCREYGVTSCMVELAGRWVFRDECGNIVDYDHSRYDLAERNGIKLIV